MNFIMRFVRSIGLFFIFAFCFVSIFLSFISQDVQNETFQKFIGFTNFFENQFYDLRMRRTLNPDFRDKNIVLVNIDDYSLQNIGDLAYSKKTSC
jgi:hypothetical protein